MHFVPRGSWVIIGNTNRDYYYYIYKVVVVYIYIVTTEDRHDRRETLCLV